MTSGQEGGQNRPVAPVVLTGPIADALIRIHPGFADILTEHPAVANVLADHYGKDSQGPSSADQTTSMPSGAEAAQPTDPSPLQSTVQGQRALEGSSALVASQDESAAEPSWTSDTLEGTPLPAQTNFGRPSGARRRSGERRRHRRVLLGSVAAAAGLAAVAAIGATQYGTPVTGGGQPGVEHVLSPEDRAVQASVTIPNWAPAGTQIGDFLQSNVTPIRNAITDPATRHEGHDTVYERRLGNVLMALALVEGGNDPKYANAGEVVPLPTNVLTAAFKILTANQRALGEPVTTGNVNSPNSIADIAANPGVDADLAVINMNQYFAGLPGSSSMSIAQLEASYAAYISQLNGKQGSTATQFGLVLSSLAGEMSPKSPSDVINGLKKNSTWESHETRIAKQ